MNNDDNNCSQSDQEIVLYDVPGYDSPHFYHKEQTCNKLENSDVYLFAKKFDQPDLVDTEVEILKVGGQKDQFVTRKDKVIVALTQIDLVSPENYDKILNDHYKAWNAFGVPKERIIPINSKAELQNNSSISNFDILKKTVKQSIYDFKNKIANERYIGLKKQVAEFKDNLFNFIKFEYKIDPEIENSETSKIQKAWWTCVSLKLLFIFKY